VPSMFKALADLAQRAVFIKLSRLLQRSQTRPLRSLPFGAGAHRPSLALPMEAHCLEGASITSRYIRRARAAHRQWLSGLRNRNRRWLSDVLQSISPNVGAADCARDQWLCADIQGSRLIAISGGRIWPRAT